MTRTIKKTLLLWLSDAQGVTGIEYGLLIGGISLGIGTGAMLFGDSFSDLISNGFGEFADKSLGG